MNKKKVMELIASGDFTIIAWDNLSFNLYEGRHTIHDVVEKKIKSVYSWNDGSDGYILDIIYDLAQALGGKTDSI